MHDWSLIVALSVLVVVAGSVIWLGMVSDVLRDAEPVDFGGAKPSPNGQYRRPYSMAQSQMAWWFCIVLGSFVYIALNKWIANGALTGDILNSILTDQSLVLMGIGTGTALGAR
jgi:hypothetical protein